MEQSRILTSEGARAAGVDKPWEGSNEAWWDWYLSLAEGGGGVPEEHRVHVEPPVAVAPATLAGLAAELAEPYPLQDVDAERFRREGYVKLREVLSPAALAAAREEVARLAAEGPGAGTSGFLSLDMMWQSSGVLRLFALAPRLGRLAADLLAVADVRLYHDNVLAKDPGCGRTPWHFDAHHFPIDSRDIVTSWIPLQEIPREMGPLQFARGIDTWKLADDVAFNAADASYDRGVDEAFREHEVDVDASPFALGEMSFHHAYCFHAAGPNGTDGQRAVMASTYFADGAPVVAEPTMVSGDWAQFIPGAVPGERIDTPMNPVVSR